MSSMVKTGHRVFIDTDIENSFLVTNKKTAKITKFLCDKCGLYVRQSDSDIKPEPDTLIDCCLNTVISHVEGFTPQEVKKARDVMKLYHDLNASYIPSLKVWLRQNMAKMSL